MRLHHIHVIRKWFRAIALIFNIKKFTTGRHAHAIQPYNTNMSIVQNLSMVQTPTMALPTICGKRCCPSWDPTSTEIHHCTFPREEDGEDGDDDEGEFYSEDSDDTDLPSVNLILGKNAFAQDKEREKDEGEKKERKKEKKKKQGQQADDKHVQRHPHFRRLRTAAPKKRGRHSEGEPVEILSKKRRRSGGVSEPQEVRDADAKMIEPHPAIIFMREHTSVKPCGRCHECRKKACGECTNCKNNVHLADRSHDRKRCTALGCTRLSDDELERYRLSHDYVNSRNKIESDLRTLRDRFMTVSSKGASSEELVELKNSQEILMKRLEIMSRAAEGAYSEDSPEGYTCLLLSFQTLETERDRVARIIDRRTTRDLPEVMRTRRQLRNFYAMTICNMVRMFANDVVARPHVEKLRAVADEYEQLVRSLPISG